MTQTRQKTGTFCADLESLRKSLDIGIDISSKNDRRITELIKFYSVEFGEFEKELLLDNCGSKGHPCTQIMWCGGEDQKLLEKARERQMKLEKQEHLAAKKRELCERNQQKLIEIHETIASQGPSSLVKIASSSEES